MIDGWNLDVVTFLAFLAVLLAGMLIGRGITHRRRRRRHDPKQLRVWALATVTGAPPQLIEAALADGTGDFPVEVEEAARALIARTRS